MSSRSNRSTPASSSTFGTDTFRNAVDKPLNHPNQCFSVLDKSILQTYFLIAAVAVGGGGGGIFTGSSSWIISSLRITVSALLSHDECDNESISWVANLFVSMLKS